MQQAVWGLELLLCVFTREEYQASAFDGVRLVLSRGPVHIVTKATAISREKGCGRGDNRPRSTHTRQPQPHTTATSTTHDSHNHTRR